MSSDQQRENSRASATAFLDTITEDSECFLTLFYLFAHYKQLYCDDPAHSFIKNHTVADHRLVSILRCVWLR